MLIIKPHHFIDIIKLYGSGITTFIPDKNYNHNFYLIANEIINNPHVQIKLTIYNDDICTPCKYINSSGLCIDSISHINQVTSKDTWNKILDQRIIKYMNLSCTKIYSSIDLCKLVYLYKDSIPLVWDEEPSTIKNYRYDMFCAGVKKYLLECNTL